MEHPTIRKAEKNDIELIVVFIRAMLEEMAQMGEHPVNSDNAFWHSFQHQLIPEIERSDRFYGIAEKSKRAVGFIEGRCDMLPDVFKSKKSFHVSCVYVIPENRHEGIATVLMKEALTFAALKGCHEADLNVLSQNKNARSVYDKLGFKVARHQMRVTLLSDEKC